ncbi:OLC1v1020499C1 [Oldenlandia corymbosa var. corymbosa]|uniref:OLC1v1020499C1 n=1 Tax=Oldenlandia corymbosa var. corymbosa TaxID=529605 RepID=A0AAV1EGL6_OLDCO|nr:OLC1v1020499C1 [Oldenlandia corymbosa var. corymbosa]
MEAKIEVISRELIKPSSPTAVEKKELTLSLLDQLQPARYIPLLFFYKRNPCDSKIYGDKYTSNATFHLKQSLSDCLTKFYPLAGKLNPGHCSINCDDSGALFVEAKINIGLSEAVHDVPYEDFGKYLPLEPYLQSEDEDGECRLKSEMMVLAVQITWFACGGNVVGVCILHNVADLMSCLTFMNSWAALNRGAGEGGTTNFSTPNFNIGTQMFLPLKHVIPSQNHLEAKKVWKRFVFDNNMLTNLKKIATTSPSSHEVKVKDPTRVEVVSAFIWKHFINVMLAKNQDDAATTLMSRIWHLVNLRRRMSRLLALPSTEFPFGNFLTCAVASFTSEEIQEEGITYANYGDLVWRTRDSIKKIDEDYVVKRVVPFVKKMATNGVGHLQPPPTTTVTERVFSSWLRFPIYEVDFGWGKPVSVGPTAAAFGDGNVVYLISTRNEEGIEAWISMSEDDFGLLPDEFLSLATTDFFQI